MTEPKSEHVSPDGHWRWNGVQWVPVQDAAGGYPSPPAAGASRPQQPPPPVAQLPPPAWQRPGGQARGVAGLALAAGIATLILAALAWLAPGSGRWEVLWGVSLLLFFPTATVAIVLGALMHVKIGRAGGALGGTGLATAAWICGVIGGAVMLVQLAIGVVGILAGVR